MTPIRMAVPNKGRLEDPTASLLAQAGLRYEKTDRALSVPVRGANVELLFVRAEDVCELVADGVAALGVTGLDLVMESELGLDVVCELGYGNCTLTAAAPNASEVAGVEDFAGLRIATSHPRSTSRFFAGKGVDITTVPLTGSVEVAPKLDVADAIVDLVSSGSTLLVNGLRPVVTLLESEAVLVATADRRADGGDTARVVTMLRAVVAARRKRYVLMNAPADALPLIEEIIPGLDAPSVVPLAGSDHVAVHSVVDADRLWDVLPRLEAAGASGILVLPIEQMIP
ncbi:MAG TPA: ATP phosphoribosyltransferase [Acidimicrobiia bacterium]